MDSKTHAALLQAIAAIEAKDKGTSKGKSKKVTSTKEMQQGAS